MAVCAIIFLLLIYVPGVSKGIDVAPMDGIAWAFAVAIGFLICSELFKVAYKRQLRRQHALQRAQNIYMNPVGYKVPPYLSSDNEGEHTDGNSTNEDSAP